MQSKLGIQSTFSSLRTSCCAKLLLRFDAQNFRHSASVTYTLVPFVTGRMATGWPHLYSIVHPYINILPER
eukprot:468194-Pleurochrysis_carterae.AAC.1